MISRSVEPEELDHLVRDPARLAALERLVIAPDESFDRIAHLLRSTFDADAAIVTLIDGERQLLKGLAGVPEPYASARELPLDAGLCPLVVTAQEPVLIADAQAEGGLSFGPMLDELGVVAYAGAPLRDRCGLILGMVCAASRTARAWSPRDRAVLQQFASFTSAEFERGVAVASAEMQRVRSQLSETRLLQSISAAMIHEENVEELYKTFVDAAVTIMRSDYGSMQMFVPERGESGELLLLASQGLDEDAQSYWKWVGVDAGSTCGQALRTRARVIAEDFRECDFALRRNDLEAFVGAGIIAAQSTPLYSREGRLLGMISTHWSRPHRPSEHDLRVFDILARQAADLLERRMAETALRESEQRFRAFVETSSDVVYRMNADWTEMRLLAGRELTGGTAAPDRDWIARYIHPDDRAAVLAQIGEAVSAKSTLTCEHRVLHPDGTTGWTQTRAIPLLGETGQVTEWFGAATDITLKKHAETQQQEALRESQRMVQTLQTALLPQTLPRLTGLRLDAAYVAAEEGALVGGDWYDAAVLPDGRTLLCVGDVTGHGLSAAVTAGKLRQATMVAALTMSDPTEILNLLNRVLRFQHADIYATAVLAFIDRDYRRMTYATAGHPPAFLAAGDDPSVVELQCGGLPLGVSDSLHAKTHEIALPERFAIALYSDGLTEFRRDITGAEQAIKRAITSLLSKPGTQRCARTVLETVLGDTRPPDDVVVLLALRDAFSRMSWTFDSSDAAAARDVRSALACATDALQATAEASFAAQVVLGEALANAVQHAPGPVDVVIECRGNELVISVRDRGPGLNDRRRPLPHDVMEEHGRGLFLIDALATDVTLRPWNEGCEMRVVLPLHR